MPDCDWSKSFLCQEKLQKKTRKILNQWRPVSRRDLSFEV